MKLQYQVRKTFNAVVFVVIISVVSNDESPGEDQSCVYYGVGYGRFMADCLRRGLFTIPKNLNNSIEGLLCSENPIREFRRSTMRLYKKLMFFNCAGDVSAPITEFDNDTFVDLKKLTVLDIRNHKMKSEVELKFPPNIEILLLGQTDIGLLNISNLRYLKIVDLQNNLITKFPEIYRYAPVNELKLRGNHIASIPLKAIAQLCKLKEFNFSPEFMPEFLNSCECFRLKNWVKFRNISVEDNNFNCTVGIQCKEPNITNEMKSVFKNCEKKLRKQVKVAPHADNSVSWHKFIGIMVVLVTFTSVMISLRHFVDRLSNVHRRITQEYRKTESSTEGEGKKLNQEESDSPIH